MNDILNIYKPAGPTSHDIVDKIRKIISRPKAYGTPSRQRRGGVKIKVGHAGTLDPFAEGVLIILIGKATKLQSKFMTMPKTYIGTLKLGWISDTYDKTGVKSKCQNPNYSKSISKAQISKILKTFIGEIKQMPPAYSAIKIKGKKAYELARKGEKPKLKPRKVKIYNIKFLNYNWPFLEIQVKCSKGTYIRSLTHDIGQKLSCGAYLEKLIRTEIGKPAPHLLKKGVGFNIKNSIKLKDLNSKNWTKKLISVNI